MTETPSSIKISIHSILVWLSIIIIFSLLIYLLISQHKTNSKNDVPVGTIIASACTTAPDGYLNCDGSEVDKNKYPTLYKVVTVLPNLKRQFLRGCDTNDVVLTKVDQSTAPNGLKITNHHHQFKSYTDGGTGQPGSGSLVASQANGYSTDRGFQNVYTSGSGTESPVMDEPLTITGDGETAPEHVLVNFFMKAK